MAGPSTQRFEAFYADLKVTEKKDAVLTPKQQIDRLLRPGSTYRNVVFQWPNIRHIVGRSD